MNKFALFGLILGWLMIATYFISAVMSYDPSLYTINSPIGSLTADNSGSELARMWAMLGNFYNILTFKVDGLPVIVTMLGFQVPLGIIVFMIIDVVKDMIPFT